MIHNNLNPTSIFDLPFSLKVFKVIKRSLLISFRLNPVNFSIDTILVDR